MYFIFPSIARVVVGLLFSVFVATGCTSSNDTDLTDGDQSTVSVPVASEASVSDDEGTSGSDVADSDDRPLSDTTDSENNNNPADESQANSPVADEQSPVTSTAAESNSTRVNFDITVPVYVSNSLQVKIVWGEKNANARWVSDESWAFSEDFSSNTENRLVVTFSDGNGDLTLGEFATVFRTGSMASEVYEITADQFDTSKWDDDGDGISNLAESTAGTDPLAENVLEPVSASFELVADKTFRFSWQVAQGAQFYRVMENRDGLSGFTQIGADLASSMQVFDHRVALYKRVNARYIVQSCNAFRCVDSEELNVSGSLVEAIGYFKASNSDIDDNFGESVALNADGTVLAVGTYLEDSAASGVNGDQNDNSAKDTGAVYVFVRNMQGWQQQAYLKASNPDDEDNYGFAISLSADGKTLAVGAYNEDSAAKGVNGDQSNNSSNNSGAVYVFTETSGSWQQQAYLKASNTNANDQFGFKVRLSGDGSTLVASAYGEDSFTAGINGDESNNSAFDAGAVYAFVRINGNWQQQAYLKASNTEAGDGFGSALGLSADGNTLAVGANYESSAATGVNGDQRNNSAERAGAVYIFERVNGRWQQLSYLKASNTDPRDIFGVRLSLSADGKTLAVAAYFEQSAATGIDGNQNDDSFPNAGAVYVFEKSNGVWQQQAYVKPSNGEANDIFGISVSLSGDGNTMVVGAFFEDSAVSGIGGNQFNNASSSSGAAYVFERSDGDWQQQAYLKASHTGIDTWFGFATSLSTDGDTLAIGARYENNNATGINGNQNNGTLAYSGAVYLY